MLVKWAILLIAMAAMAECQRMFPSANPRARPSHSPRRQGEGSIVRFNPTHPISYPWQVYITILKVYGGIFIIGANYCGGATISLNWVMSAAHCFADGVDGQPGYILKPQLVTIYAGVYNRARVESDPDVQTNEYLNQAEINKYFFIHPEYGMPTKDNNDIALIKLKVPWKSTPKVSPITLGNIYDFMPRYPLTVTGWGQINGNTNKSFPNYLHEETNLIPISDTECSNYFLDTEWKVTDRMICTQQKGESPCHGDSGGPLTTGSLVPNGRLPALVGIVSWGMPNCTPSAPIVYTNVTYFKPWIYTTMLPKCHPPWFPIGDQCFLKVEEPLQEWNFARSRCKQQASGADLAQPRDLKALNNYISKNGKWTWYWLGGSNLEGAWNWINGSSIIHSYIIGGNWNHNGPNRHDCIAMEKKNGYISERSLKNIECGRHGNYGDVGPYICERSLK